MRQNIWVNNCKAPHTTAHKQTM